MTEDTKARVAIVIPVGPGKEAVLDTLESVETFCTVPHRIILVDDQTSDGTYEALQQARRPHWDLIRNDRKYGWKGIVHTLCNGYARAVASTECELILKLDVDALVIKPGLFEEALAFLSGHPEVGIFGVYDVDYNRPRSFESHRKLFDRETAWYRAALGLRPVWWDYLRLAESKGYRRGENVFGGAYFLSRACAGGMKKLGALETPRRFNSIIAEDVYFSMLSVATGFRLAHFAAPEGPLCLEWRGLPFPAEALAASRFKLVHSVDRGPNTGPDDNQGRTAREVFRALRAKYLQGGKPRPALAVLK